MKPARPFVGDQTAHYQLDAAHTEFMWWLSRQDVETLWAPQSVATPTPTSSAVAATVAKVLAADAPHLLHTSAIGLPTLQGDDHRAMLCLLWLVHEAMPLWTPYRAGLLRKADLNAQPLEDLAKATTLNEISTALHALHFELPGMSRAHRRSVQYAQSMGVRAIYNGAAIHKDKSVGALAKGSALIILGCIPNQNPPAMLVEATQGAALTLLDRLLEEVEDVASDPQGPRT